MSNEFENRADHLRRLPPEYYQGQAYVHWTMTIENRATGWLIPIVYYKFREILTHTMFRNGLACPIYCCMPDHLHLLWIGLTDNSDQLIAAKFFRKHFNAVLEKLKFQFQSQPYDHVLREKELEKSAFEDTAKYIAENPERNNLVGESLYQDYKYTDCLFPGYPDLHFVQTDFWERFWRIHSFMQKHGLVNPRRV